MKITTNSTEFTMKLKKEMKKFPEKISRGIKIGLFSAGQEMRNRAITLAPFKSGDLRRSIGTDPATYSQIENQIKIGSNKVYARIQDLGGIIRGNPFLKIPLNAEGKSGTIDGFFIRSKKGNPLFVRKTGKHGIKPLFVLVKTVRIKGKPYLSRAFKVMQRGRLSQIMTKELENQFKIH